MSKNTLVWKDITAYQRGEKLLGVPPRHVACALNGTSIVLQHLSEEAHTFIVRFFHLSKNFVADTLEAAKLSAIKIFHDWLDETRKQAAAVLGVDDEVPADANI